MALALWRALKHRFLGSFSLGALQLAVNTSDHIYVLPNIKAYRRSDMHPCLGVDEILRFIAHELVESEAKATAVSLACCCKCFEDPVLDTLWETQYRLTPLLKCFPRDAWDEEYGRFSFRRLPTKAEWADFQKHAQRMRHLKVDTSEDPTTIQDLIPLQFRAGDKPFLLRLKTFVCKGATEAFIPSIPFFLSPKITQVAIGFAEHSSTTAIVSLITELSTLCLDLEHVVLNAPSTNPVIAEAVSKMVLACNRNSLQTFQVNSPLTKEAREVVCQLPRLTSLCTVVEGPTLLPTVSPPNLTVLGVECGDDLGWLQIFRGTNLEKLESVTIEPTKADHIDDILRAFESVTLTTSVPNTLSSFKFLTMSSWEPDYHTLLSFRQLEHLEIEFSCDGGCSSRVDDDIVISLAQAMPKLEILLLGGAPCKTPGGVTVDGLMGLACRCPHLSELRVHFDATSLAHAAATGPVRGSPSDSKSVVRRGDCALEDLKVGEIPVPGGLGSEVASTLLQIFPRIRNVEYENWEWNTVTETIRRDSGRTGASIRGPDRNLKRLNGAARVYASLCDD